MLSNLQQDVNLSGAVGLQQRQLRFGRSAQLQLHRSEVSLRRPCLRPVGDILHESDALANTTLNIYLNILADTRRRGGSGGASRRGGDGLRLSAAS